MPEYARRNFDPETAPKKYCRLCGHKLAGLNEGDTCFRHLADDVAQEKNKRSGRGIRRVTAVRQLEAGVQKLLLAVCAVWRISLSELLGTQYNRPEITEARYVAIFMLVDRDGMEKSDVAEIFQRSQGGLNYPLARIRTAWERDSIPDLKEKVRQVEETR